MSCGVGRRYDLDLALLWLWLWLAAAAPIQPLAWELSYATSAALKKKNKEDDDKAIRLTSVNRPAFIPSSEFCLIQ